MWNAGLDGVCRKAAGIGFGIAAGTAVEGLCLRGAAAGGSLGVAAGATPCMAAGEAAGSFAEERTVAAWS